MVNSGLTVEALLELLVSGQVKSNIEIAAP